MRNDRWMANWDDVGATALTLPEVTVGQAHEGSPAYDVAGRQFARLRHDESRQILHFWVADVGAKQALIGSEPSTYWTVGAFAAHSSLWAWLDQLERRELRELLVESWYARAPKRLAKAHPDLR
jgi:hypothetical protein